MAIVNICLKYKQGTKQRNNDDIYITYVDCNLKSFLILKFSLVSQSCPVKPLTQMHVYELTPSTQVAPFWQGSDSQSSISKRNEKVISVP